MVRFSIGTSTCRWATLLLGLVLFAIGAETQTSSPLNRFEFTEPEMGVPFRIVLYAPNETIAHQAAQAAFHRIAQLNEIMSDYETDSEISELSRTSGQNKTVPVSEDLWNVLERAQQLAELSGGAFDITVGPVVSLWRKARRSQQMPDPGRLAEALKAVGYQKVRLHPATHGVELLVPGMKLDLGGIAKGYALGEAVKTLAAHGVRRGLVTGGGDMSMGDPPPGETGWRIEIAPLDVPNAPPRRFVRLANSALATSGDVFQKLEINGRRYSHIVDPRTGVGLIDHSLVTVIVKDGATADGLSTAVSVLGPENALAFIQKIPGAVMHVVRKPNDQIEFLESPGFDRYYEAP